VYPNRKHFSDSSKYVSSNIYITWQYSMAIYNKRDWSQSVKVVIAQIVNIDFNDVKAAQLSKSLPIPHWAQALKNCFEVGPLSHPRFFSVCCGN